MKNINRIFINFLIIICGIQAKSQDIHFSQPYAAPLLINPALTGYFYGNQRVILNYKDQWSSIGSTYKTAALQYDAIVLKKHLQIQDKIGLGFSFFNDQAGGNSFGITQGNIMLSYSKKLDPRNAVSLGFQGGFVQYKYNPENLTWDNQYDGTFNPSLSSNEPINKSNISYIDLAGGILWDYRFDKYTGANLGISLYHINPEKLNFYSSSEALNLYRRITIHGTIEKKLHKSETSFYPGFIYRRQGPSQEIIYGAMIKYQLSEEKHQSNILETAFHIGVFHRFGDSFIFMTKFSYMHFALGISYDINASKLSDASRYKGGLEFSLSYTTPYERRFRGNALL